MQTKILLIIFLIGLKVARSTLDPSYTNCFHSLLLAAKDLNDSISLLDKINISEIYAWEKFHGRNYEWLPTRPTGIARKWHSDLQIYIFAFAKLYENQLDEEKCDSGLDSGKHNCHHEMISEELKVLRDKVTELLEYLGDYMRAFSYEPVLFGKRQMKQDIGERLATSPSTKLNNLFVKARFSQYLDKMLRRIRKFSFDKNLRRDEITRQKTKRRHRGRKTNARKTRKNRNSRGKRFPRR